MGLFTDYLYENLPYIDITMEDVERIAKHHFPDNEIYREGKKLFIKSNKIMDARRFEFRANAELTIEKSKLCFKTKVNNKTLLFYLLVFLFLLGLMAYRYYDIYEIGNRFIVGNYMFGFMATYGFKMLIMFGIYFLVFAFSLAYQLNKVSKFLVQTIMAAIKIYKMQ